MRHKKMQAESKKNKNKTLMAVFVLGLMGTVNLWAQDCQFSSAPDRTLMERSIYGTSVNLLWSEATDATAYTLYYAPFSDPIDATTLNNVNTVNLGTSTNITADLPMGSNFYVALQPSNCAGAGPISNLHTLNINDQASTSLLDINLTFSGKVNSTTTSRDFTDADKALFFQAVEIWRKAIRGVSGLMEAHSLDITVSVPSTLPGDGAASVADTITVGENILPVSGELQINGAKYDADYLDPANYTAVNKMEDLANIVHEIGHILGIGALWSEEDRNFITNSAALGGNIYQQPKGLAQYQRVFSTTINYVPIAANAAHYYDYILSDDTQRTPTDGSTAPPPLTYELMANSRFLSRVTLGMLEDIGWTVDYTMADIYPIGY